MQKIFLVGLGGFLGAVSRYGIGHVVKLYFESIFPYATLIVNFAGCVSIGFIYEYFKTHSMFPVLSLFLITGFLGAFTTFSAFSFETVRLIQNNETTVAFLNIMGSVCFCLLAVILGAFIGAWLFKVAA